MSRSTIQVLRFCLATGCRQGEAAGMVRGELDLAARLWTLPAQRSKNKRSHAVPLSPLALAILREALDGHSQPAVLPGAVVRP